MFYDIEDPNVYSEIFSSLDNEDLDSEFSYFLFY